MAEQVANTVVISKDQMQGIANMVVNALTPQPLNPVDSQDLPEGASYSDDSQSVVYADAVAKGIEEAEAELIKTLPRGTCIYKSRNGSQMVNHTTESLNYLQDLKKNRKDFRTRSRI